MTLSFSYVISKISSATKFRKFFHLVSFKSVHLFLLLTAQATNSFYLHDIYSSLRELSAFNIDTQKSVLYAAVKMAF